MIVGASEINVSVIVKHIQHIGVVRAFRLPGINFSMPGWRKGGWGGQKKLLGCVLLGGISAQADTVFIVFLLSDHFVW